MQGYYELNNNSNDQFHFILKAGNHETILTSESYTQKNSAENGIKSVQKNCRTDKQYDKKTSSNGKWYFNLKAANHQIIGTSQMYSSEAACDKGIASVQKNGSTAAINDNT